MLLRQHRTKSVRQKRSQMYVKEFLCNMTGNIQVYDVQSRQTCFVQCCLKIPLNVFSTNDDSLMRYKGLLNPTDSMDTDVSKICEVDRRCAFALRKGLTQQMLCIAAFSRKGFLEMPLR